MTSSYTWYPLMPKVNVKIIVIAEQRKKYHEDDARSGVSDTDRPYTACFPGS